MTMYDDAHFTRDAATATIDDDADGITVDDDGEPNFDWDEVERVTIDNPPHANAFDTKEFYKIPATVAKPIPQPYQYGEDSVWLKKPREELKKAAWSLDNAPWTLGHPDTGMVKDVDDVRGFWSEPRYHDALDDLDADLHVPVGDDEAREYLEENGDVSVGFYNRIARIDEYDGVVGGEDDEGVDIDGYQTNMLFDHCASVGIGRCPSEQGCGISADGRPHGHVTAVDDSLLSDTRITDTSDSVQADETTSVMAQKTDSPSGIHVADDTWFAVGPDEHPDESTDYPDDAKFPVDSCQSVADAWNLRGTGDISIDQETLEARIRRAAEAMDCSLPDGETDAAVAESAKRYSICGARAHVMEADIAADDDCGCPTDTDPDTDNTDTDMELEFDDLSAEAALDKVAERNDSVEDRLDELREATDVADIARDAADELGLDSVDDLTDTVAMLSEKNDELRERVDELQRPQMEDDAAYIAEHTDRYGDDADEVIERLDEDPDAVADKRELVEDLVDEYDETTANPGDLDSGADSGTETTGKYASTPW